jgi:hypothetical protein
VQLANEGDYRVFVTDQIGSAASPSARLSPLIRPLIVDSPLTQLLSKAGLSV